MHSLPLRTCRRWFPAEEQVAIKKIEKKTKRFCWTESTVERGEGGGARAGVSCSFPLNGAKRQEPRKNWVPTNCGMEENNTTTDTKKTLQRTRNNKGKATHTGTLNGTHTHTHTHTQAHTHTNTPTKKKRKRRECRMQRTAQTAWHRRMPSPVRRRRERERERERPRHSRSG